MIIKLALLLVVVVVFIVASEMVYAEADNEAFELIKTSTQVLEEMQQQPDVEQMALVLERAKAIAIFPNMIKAGLGLGGQYGKGLLLRRDSEGQWYGPVFFEMKGLSYGWQIGFQSTSLVLVIANERGLDSFLEGNFKLGGDASLAIGPIGRRVELSTDLKLEASIYSYSLSKGAFAGLSLEGVQISPHAGLNTMYWQEDAKISVLIERSIEGEATKELVARLLNVQRKRGDDSR